MTLQLILTFGGIILAAAAAIYWSMPERPSIQRNGEAQRQNSRRRPNQNNHTATDDQNRYPKSKPGDKCLFCHKVMTNDGMQRMRCGHALCNECYLTCRFIRTTCPYCSKVVFQITEVGEDCVVCRESMLTTNTMTYMNCEHALHTSCLSIYRQKGYMSCPICKCPLDQN